MKKKITRDISVTSLQVIITQLTGLGTFYITSAFLEKNVFGEINWSLALLVTSFTILGCGIDQIVVKKIASGSGPSILSLYTWHVLATGLFFYGTLLICYLAFASFFQQHQLLVWLGISQALLYFSTPFKQLALGKEDFRLLFIMSICSNTIRVLVLLALAIGGRLTITAVLTIYVISAAAELLVSYFLARNKWSVQISTPWNKKEYISLIKLSLPQLGTVIFNSAVARFDWIFLGLFSTANILANYSFAYKVYELCTLPLLIIAPLLLPRFVRFFSPGQQNNLQEKKEALLVLVRLEIVIASFIALVLNLAWAPFIDSITGNKYGAVNVNNILILSCTMPFLYVNNFLWTINFAQGRLKLIFSIITIVFLINIIGDIIMIPLWQDIGAAIAFLMAIVIQTIIYMRKTQFLGFSKLVWSLIICPAAAILSGWLAMIAFNNFWLIIPAGIILFTVLLFISRQIRLKDWLILKKETAI
jgi:O-antigen/teichoic acid export membrane protein